MKSNISYWGKGVFATRIFFQIIKTSILVRYQPADRLLSKYPNTNNYITFSKVSNYWEYRFIKKMIKLVPWHVTCLMECLIVKDFFMKYDLNLPIHIGVDITNGFSAHAWYQEMNNRGYIKILSV